MRQDNTGSKPIQGIDTTPASSVSIREINKRYLSKFPITDHAQTFIVSIEGKNAADKRVSVEWIFDARHPYMALGEALVRFSKEYFISSIEQWKVAEPCYKPRNNKV